MGAARLSRGAKADGGSEGISASGLGPASAVGMSRTVRSRSFPAFPMTSRFPLSPGGEASRAGGRRASAGRSGGTSSTSWPWGTWPALSSRRTRRALSSPRPAALTAMEAASPAYRSARSSASTAALGSRSRREVRASASRSLPVTRRRENGFGRLPGLLLILSPGSLSRGLGMGLLLILLDRPGPPRSRP